MNKNKIVSLVFVFILLSSPMIAAQDRKIINFAIEETPPYAFIEDNKLIGILPDIVRAAYKERNYSLKIQILPPKRCSVWAENGRIDGIIGVANGISLFKGEIFSDILIQIKIHPITLSETIIPYKTIDDIKPYRVGIISGVGFESEFPELKVDTVSNTNLNIEKLLRKRFDIIVENPVIANYILMKKTNKNNNRLKVLFPPLKEIDLVIGFSSATIDHKKKYNDFNKCLAIIKRNGIYDNILKKWKVKK